jgi:hypothetical protein
MVPNLMTKGVDNTLEKLYKSIMYTQKMLIKTVISLIFLFLLSCNNNTPKEQIHKVSQVPRKDAFENKANIDLVGIEKIKDVFPDTSINGKLRLDNQISSKEFYLRIDEVILIEQIRDSPITLFTNRQGNEYLMAYQYEGGVKNAFSCFEIGYQKDLSGQIPNKTKETSFKTESNICLGITLHDVELIKGKNYLKNVINSSTIVVKYGINDMDLSPFLKRYNMPGYFLELTLKDTKVTKVFFGFDYP